MNEELKKKIESLKVEPVKGKKKGCSSCKKKAAVTKLPELIEIDENIYVPTQEEIINAYVELGNKDRESVKASINKVYSAIFGESFDFGCGSCANTQVRKFKAYINNTLKINI